MPDPLFNQALLTPVCISSLTTTDEPNHDRNGQQRLGKRTQVVIVINQ